MKNESLFNAIGGADADLLERSEHKPPVRDTNRWTRWGLSAAACIMAVVAVAVLYAATKPATYPATPSGGFSTVMPSETPSPDENPLGYEIGPVPQVDTNGLTLVWHWQDDQQLLKLNAEAVLVVYAEGTLDERGTLLTDDSADWMVTMETSSGIYPLFPRTTLYNGRVTCSLFTDGMNATHVLVSVTSSAFIELYDYILEPGMEIFRGVPIYDAKMINFITSSQ